MHRLGALLLAGLAGLAMAACSKQPPGTGMANGSQTEVAADAAADGIVANPGFENGTKDPWTTNVHADPYAYQFDLVTDVVATGNYAVRIMSEGTEPWGGLMQYLDNAGLNGRTVVLSASVKAENVADGVQLLAVFRGTTAMPFEHTFADLGASFDWQRLEREFQVPDGTKAIEIGIMQMGTGTLWVDDITLMEKQ